MRGTTDKESESPELLQTTKRNTTHQSRSVLSNVLQTKEHTNQKRRTPRRYSHHNQILKDKDQILKGKDAEHSRQSTKPSPTTTANTPTTTSQTTTETEP